MNAIFISEQKEMFKQVYIKEYVDFLKKRLDTDGEVYNKTDIKSNPKLCKDVEYIFSTWDMPELDESEIKTLFPKLKCIFYAAGTIKYFAKPFWNCGVRIFSAKAANGIPVAEYTVSQIILANKGMFFAAKNINSQNFESVRSIAEKFSGNFEQSVGLIGVGMIAKKVIRLLENYDVNIMVYDPYLSDSDAECLNVKKCTLAEIFETCNVISNHMANTKETEGMLDYNLFKRMKPYSTFINTGRGAQVAEDDLIRVLKGRDDIMALLDVTYPEPPHADNPLFEMNNCILTPHIAGSKHSEYHRMAKYMIDEYMRYSSGEKCLYEERKENFDIMA